ncbi:MAG: MarR family transcriptional regulator [Opitutus sp.]|nr:MarR family transcriptional regulator [Opitutus sp.]
MKPPSPPEAHLEAWRRYYVSFWRIFAAIEADLQAAGLPSLSWYDALYELYLAPGRHLRMSALARSALLSRSGLTRLVDRLEQEKLIERKSCPKDGRVQHAMLTDRGVETLRKIWPVYRAGIAKYFAAHLTEAEAKEFARVVGKIAAAMQPAQSGDTAGASCKPAR